MALLKEILPEFYSNLLDKNLLQSDATETKATCGNCLRSRDKRFLYLYKPHLKCCTFYPFVPNFAVGGILDKKLPGAAVIENKIKERQFTLPLGVFPTLKFQYEFINREFEDFGNREDLLCPYYNKTDQNCGIWEFRGVVCTTYHCTSDRGKAGQARWSQLSNYLSYIEMSLAEECLVQLDFSPLDISDQLVFLNRTEWSTQETTQEILSATEFKSFWNGYTDHQEFYAKCYNHVRNLTKKEFKEIMGEQGAKLAQALVLES